LVYVGWSGCYPFHSFPFRWVAAIPTSSSSFTGKTQESVEPHGEDLQGRYSGTWTGQGAVRRSSLVIQSPIDVVNDSYQWLMMVNIWLIYG